MDVSGRRVTLMGLGCHGGGIGAARYLAGNGAVLTVTDLRPREALTSALSALDDLADIRYVLGGHDESAFRNAELIVVNPAVRPDNPWLQRAAEADIPLTSEIELLLRAVDCHTAVVTGSNGKSTTASMLAAILAADGRQVHLGGNLGGSLLASVDKIERDDWMVLELSSFQLDRLPLDAARLEVVVVTGCTANHLDWHPTLVDYHRAKQRALQMLASNGTAVLNTWDSEVAGWQRLVRDRWSPPAALADVPPLKVPGRHNRHNAACAAAAAVAAGVQPAVVRRALLEFTGLPHRLDRIATVAGRTFIDDSSATTPEATAAALDSVAQPVWLLLGGRAKGSSWATLVSALSENVRGVACYGEAAAELADTVREARRALNVRVCDDMPTAMRWCFASSAPGHSIMLSPACASSDQFSNYVERAKTFHRLIDEIALPEGAQALA